MTKYIYAPFKNNLQTAQGRPWVAPAGVTLAQAWPNSYADWVDITALSAAPAPGSTYVNGVWTAPVAPSTTPTNAQQAAKLLAGGLTITSTSNPTLNGTYAIDAKAQSAINAVSTYVLVNNSFPSGSTQPYLDMAGNAHVFTTTAEWQAFATVVAKVVAQITLFGAGQGTAPAMTGTIP